MAKTREALHAVARKNVTWKLGLQQTASNIPKNFFIIETC